MYIDGTGVVLPGITGMEAFDEALSKPHQTRGSIIQDPLLLKTKLKNRRIDKYIRMAMYSVEQAMEHEDRTHSDEYEFASVTNSIYGPEDSVMEFQKYMHQKQYEYCSPVTFSNSVFNSALGNICLNYGLKGHSVALVNSNYVEYANRLIHSGKAKRCIVTGVENINSEKERLEQESGSMLSEGSVSFVVGKEATEYSCARLLTIQSKFVSKITQPEICDLTEEIEEALHGQKLNKDEIDVVVGFAQQHPYIDDKQLLVQLGLDNKAVYEPKCIFHNTMGAALGVHLLTAIRSLHKKKGRIALGLEYDMVGLFTYYLIERLPRER